MKKLIVVTGGTKGIGKALIHKFSVEGFDAVTCSRNQSDLEALKKEVEAQGGSLMVHRADLSLREDVTEFARQIISLNRPVDVLVNNAGIFVPGQITEEPEGTLETMIHTNLYSAYHLTRALIKPMMKRGEGHIFNLCSTASIIPYTNGGSYCISKFALYGMSKVLREETKNSGVRVTSVLPGATLTPSWEGVELPEERFMKAEDIALAVWNAYTLSGRTVIEELLLRPQLGDL